MGRFHTLFFFFFFYFIFFIFYYARVRETHTIGLGLLFLASVVPALRRPSTERRVSLTPLHALLPSPSVFSLGRTCRTAIERPFDDKTHLPARRGREAPRRAARPSFSLWNATISAEYSGINISVSRHSSIIIFCSSALPAGIVLRSNLQRASWRRARSAKRSLVHDVDNSRAFIKSTADGTALFVFFCFNFFLSSQFRETRNMSRSTQLETVAVRNRRVNSSRVSSFPVVYSPSVLSFLASSCDPRGNASALRILGRII